MTTVNTASQLRLAANIIETGHPWKSHPQAPADPYADLKAAQAAGKVIQFNPGDSLGWRDHPGDFTVGPEYYRIKPDMNKPPITAGSWVLSHKDSAVVLTTANKAEATNPIVAECPGYKREREANARAIAALPELLAALEYYTSASEPEAYKDASGELLMRRADKGGVAREALVKAGYQF